MTNKKSSSAVNASIRQVFLNELNRQLASLGFVQTVDLPPSFEMRNDDQIVRLYPVISKKAANIEFRPIVAAENMTLRHIFHTSPHPLRATHSVCHIDLASLGGWGIPQVSNASDVAKACDQVVHTMREKALPLLRPFLSVRGAEELFEADMNHAAPVGLVVLFPSEKLSLLREAREGGKLPMHRA